MNEQPLDDPFLNFVERVSGTIQRKIPAFARWLFAAIFLSALGAWFWFPLLTGAFLPLGEGKWVQARDYGTTQISGGEGLALGLVASVFAPWCWVQVLRIGRSTLRRYRRN